MPLKKCSFKATEAQRGQRLDQALAVWLPDALGEPVSKAKVRKLVVAGAVYLNGKRVRIASKILLPGAKVDAFVDLAKLKDDGRARDRAFELTADRILFEDAAILVVDKPPGLPTQPTLDEARDNLFKSVKKFLAARDGVVDPYLALHHRLDRDTSGVLLLAKAREANAGVARLFTEHLARKTYLALAERPARLPPRDWRVKNFLARDRASGKRSRFHSVRSGGDAAETAFRLLEEAPRALRIEARPLTGRTHQIRVHLSEGGTPIFGDETYGRGTSERAPRLMLHAARLEFPHPLTGAPLSIEAPIPSDLEQCWASLKHA